MKKNLAAFQRKLTNKDIKQIINLYGQGFSCDKLADKFSVSRSLIIRYLKRNNVELRNNKDIIEKFDPDEKKQILDLYKQGVSCRKLANMFKLHKSTITRYLRNNDFVIRPISNSQNSINNNKTKLKSEEIKEIIKLYQEGLSTNKIAVKLGFSRGCITKQLKVNNITLRGKGKFVEKLTSEQQEQAVKIYLSGKSSSKAAKEFQVGRDVIRRILRLRGIKVRSNKNNFKFPQEHINKIIELYKRGVNTLKIAKLFNCHFRTINGYLTRNGIEINCDKNGKPIRKNVKVKELPNNNDYKKYCKITYKNLDIVRDSPEQVYRLDLSDQDLNDLPIEITNCNNLRYLNLSNNYIDCIPPEINKLFNLNFLDLSDNNLNQLPIEIFQLSKLETLNLEQNFFTKIPDDIRFLYKLKYFNASSNKLSIFSSALLKLDKLEKLELQNNNIRRLPSEINKLMNLQILNLAENKLSILPTKLNELINLKILKLSKNKITFLPENLKQLPNLQIITT